MKIGNYYAIQQDTLVQPQQRQNQPVPNIVVPKPQLDLERAEEVIKQFDLREQEIIVSQDSLKNSRIQRFNRIQNSTIPDSSISDSTIYDAPSTKSIELEIFESLNPFESFNPVERQISYPSSITLFLICGLVLLTVIRYYFGKNLRETFRSFFDYRQALRMFEEHRESDRQAAFLSNILFAWITGIFFSIALPFIGAKPLWGSYVLSILFFSAFTGLLYMLKARIWKALGVIFMMQNLSKTYIYNMFLYNRNIGLMIFPMVAVIPFVSEIVSFYMLYSILAVFALSYLFKCWRIFQIIHTRSVSVFYFILYLCTLEILPLLLFAKGCKILSEKMVM